MQESSNLKQLIKDKKIALYFQPTWYSTMVAVIVGLLLTAGVVVDLNLPHGDIHLILDNLPKHHTSQQALTLPGQPVAVNHSSLSNTWPLIAFWAFVGLVVYVIIEDVIKHISQIRTYVDELNYVHARPRSMVRQTLSRLFIRIVSLIIWLIFTNLFFKEIIPWSLGIAHSSSHHLHQGHSYIKLTESFIVIFLCMQLHTFFIRVLLTRPRIFYA